MTNTTTTEDAMLDNDVRVSEAIMDIRREAGNQCVTCPTCCHPRTKPHRVISRKIVVEGCVDACHTDTMLGLFGASRDWHFRPRAVEMRAETLRHLRAL